MKIFIVFCCLILSSLHLTLSAQETADILFRNKEIKLGEVPPTGKDYMLNYIFTNTGKKPLVIYRVKASCGCVKIKSWPKAPVMPQKQDTIRAFFSPKGQKGFFSKSILVDTNTPKGSYIIRFKGRVSNPTK